jgi:hypothetical protein
MFHIIATDENQPAARIDCGGIENLETRVPVAAAANEGRRATAPAQDPENADQADKADADADDRNCEPAAIGAHQVFDHLRHSSFLRWLEKLLFATEASRRPSSPGMKRRSGS